jgi:hypothetical protein
MSIVSDLYEVVTERIRAEEDAPVTLEQVRVKTGESEDSFVASAIVMNEIDETIKTPENSEEMEEYLEAKKEARETEVEINNDSMANWVSETLADFVESTNYTESETTSEPSLRFVDEGELRAVMDVTVSPTDVSGYLDDARTLLNNTSQMIPSEESLRTMTVRLTDFNYDEDDWETPHHDFTIYFATDEPHTYWANCETIEDYFEMIVDNNENTTVEEMRNKDEYYSHTHLMNKNNREIFEWLESFTTGITSEHITTGDTITVFPYRIEVDFETDETSLKCNIRKTISD